MSSFLTQQFNKFNDWIHVHDKYNQDPARMLPYLIKTQGEVVKSEPGIEIGATMGAIQTVRANLDGLKKLDAMPNVKSIAFSR